MNDVHSVTTLLGTPFQYWVGPPVAPRTAWIICGMDSKRCWKPCYDTSIDYTFMLQISLSTTSQSKCARLDWELVTEGHWSTECIVMFVDPAWGDVLCDLPCHPAGSSNLNWKISIDIWLNHILHCLQFFIRVLIENQLKHEKRKIGRD